MKVVARPANPATGKNIANRAVLLPEYRGSALIRSVRYSLGAAGASGSVRVAFDLVVLPLIGHTNFSITTAPV